jgi:hypothetical protein
VVGTSIAHALPALSHARVRLSCGGQRGPYRSVPYLCISVCVRSSTVVVRSTCGGPAGDGPARNTSTAGIHATGQLVAGTIVSLRHLPDGDGPRERIGIRRDDGQVVYIRWSKRVLVVRQESEADGWLRRQLALLRAR